MTRTQFKKSVVLATLFSIVLASCRPSGPAPRETVGFEGAIMGTTYHITVVAAMSDDAAADLAQQIETGLKHVDKKMSTYKPDSELSVLNGAPGGSYHPLTKETFALLQLSQEIGRETDGAFDVTIGPLVNLWGFGPEEWSDPPSDEAVASRRALVGPDALALDSLTTSVKKKADDVYCDLSGIAKGYAVDLVAEILEAAGHPDYMVEVGGEIRTGGQNASNVPWNIAIEKPVSETRVLQEVVGLSDMALATSGNYRNYYEVDGRRYAHTIDPKTGRPVTHDLASVSVLHPRCAMADAYATALMVLGPERGMAVAEERGLPVMMVLHGPEGTFTTKQTDSFAPFVVTP